MLADYNLAYHKGGLILTLGATVVGKTLQDIIHARDLSGLQTEFDRIYQNVESDPAAAVTVSCALLESLFKTYIEERGLEMPTDQTVKPLWKVVRKDLKLDPTMVGDEDLKTILGGLAATVDGIGSLRTHKGSAHGRGKKAYKIEPLHARLAAHAAFHSGEFHSGSCGAKVRLKRKPECAEMLHTLGTRYENRTFLPNVRDVQRFLARTGSFHGRVLLTQSDIYSSALWGYITDHGEPQSRRTEQHTVRRNPAVISKGSTLLI